MSSLGFELIIPVFKRAKTVRDLDCAATLIFTEEIRDRLSLWNAYYREVGIFPIKIILITPSSVIKMYLYVHMPLHVSVNNNHHQQAKQHLKETTITWYTIHQIRLYRIFI
jgi:hypothetical protein